MTTLRHCYFAYFHNVIIEIMSADTVESKRVKMCVLHLHQNFTVWEKVIQGWEHICQGIKVKINTETIRTYPLNFLWYARCQYKAQTNPKDTHTKSLLTKRRLLEKYSCIPFLYTYASAIPTSEACFLAIWYEYLKSFGKGSRMDNVKEDEHVHKTQRRQWQANRRYSKQTKMAY